jgi:hypothetical protein
MARLPTFTSNQLWHCTTVRFLLRGRRKKLPIRISNGKWDEQVFRIGETIPMKNSSQHLIAEVPQTLRMMQLSRARLLLATVSGIVLAACPLPAQAPHSGSTQEIRQRFLIPPADARPMVRWWWFGVAVTKPEILRELQQMKADGIGGAELAFVYPEVLDDPSRGLKNLPFLSPAMLNAVNYAQSQGRKLGLRIDVTLCSGWPYGGPATPLSEAAGRLRTVVVAVPANATSIALPTLAEGESLISASIASGEPKHWTAASAAPLDLQLPNALTIAPADGHRVALFFIAGHTRQQVKRAAVGAEGYVLDPFSHQAVATHLRAVGEPLVEAFGSTPPYAIFSDSLEAYGADWTPMLPEEFRKRRGYDLIPHLPELVAGGSPAADMVRHDYGRTLTELVDENYLTQINDWAIAHHTRFRSQTYGEPAVSLASQRLVALPEGEGPQWRAFSTLRWASSANHLFGNNVTSGEGFTWLHSPVFRATPLDMKAEADIDFLMGENQLIFHGWPYSAPGVAEPGWSLYAAGAFNDHNPWHPVMPAVTAYITRLSYLLRQGKSANQVAVLLPTDDAWASFSPGKVTITGAMQKLITPELMSAILSAGYNVDFIDADTIDRQGIGDHQILVIPPTDRIPVETLRRIDDFAAHDGKVIAVGKVPSIDAEGNQLPDTSQLAPIALVPGTEQLPQALHDAARPDLTLTKTDDHAREVVGFIHRKLPNADIYFVANTSNVPITAEASFGSSHNSCENWDPETGMVTPCDFRTIHLAPYESAVYIFHTVKPDRHTIDCSSSLCSISITPLTDHVLQDLSSNWRVTFPSLNKSVTESALTDWIADPATLHYSGEAIYSRDFTLTTTPHSSVYLQIDGGTPLPGSPNSPLEHAPLGPDGLPNLLVTRTGSGMRAYFDPPIREAALVTVNGQAAGALWHPPYRLDVTKLLKPGKNHIEIHVYNTVLNAWTALSPHDYGPLIQKYGDRFQMQDLDRVKPVSSGILGAIHLVSLGFQ